MTKSSIRAKQFAAWDHKPVKDYDPEAEPPSDDNASSEGENSEDENAGTEHYVAISKSGLRKKKPLSLGPEYRGKRVSREALEQYEDEDEDEDGGEGNDEPEYDNPDLADLERDQALQEDEDAEIESEDVFCESDEEAFKDYTFRGSSMALPVRGKRVKRPVAADFLVDDEASEDSDVSGEERVQRLEGEDDGEEDEEDDEDEEEDASDLDGFIDDGPLSGEDEEEDGLEDELSSGEEDGLGEEKDESDDEEEEGGASIPQNKPSKLPKDILKEFNTDRNMPSTLLQSVQNDANKGQAIRQQRQGFDAALNLRIRLQKALVAVNSFSTIDSTSDFNCDLVSSDLDQAQPSEPYRVAEEAAIKLWSAIDGFRSNIQADNHKTGQKRKRAPIDISTSSQDIWDQMQKIDRVSSARRTKTLEHWSAKVRKTSITDRSANGIKDMSINFLLASQLQDSERLIKRTRTPRSCAPAQVARRLNEDPEIYDDADFYQLLLKELVDQRTADTSATTGQAATVRYMASQAVKEAKTKKHVDTKASKGRKMRFGVHDKLVNFMVPEDRRAWEQSAIDRFFSTLFGQSLVLNEDEGDDNEEEGGSEGEEMEGLKLFRG